VPEGGIVMAPQKIGAPDTDLCMAISNEGRMLLFPAQYPAGARQGKGNKLISIPSARVKARRSLW
jgi:topoisomerase-4 subunit A